MADQLGARTSGGGSFLHAGLEVIRHGVRPLPAVLTYLMTIATSYWTATESAVVTFLYFSENPVNGGMQALATIVRYRMEKGEWASRNFERCSPPCLSMLDLCRSPQ